MNLWSNYLQQIKEIFRNNLDTKTFIIQKDMWFPGTKTEIIDDIGIIDCSEVYKATDLATLFTDVKTNQTMNSLEMVNYMQKFLASLGIDTELGRGYVSKAIYAESFIRNFFFEQHGSGANATFYLVYKLMQYLIYCDEHNIDQPRAIINNYESFLHHLTARAWLKGIHNVKELNACIIANKYELFDLGLFFNDEDPAKHFYVVDDLLINNIRYYRPDLRKAHNIEKMLREGVFGENYKVG